VVMQDFVARRGYVSEILCVTVFFSGCFPFDCFVVLNGPAWVSGGGGCALQGGVPVCLYCRKSGVGGQTR
jgi:hypothetical protein